MEVNMKSKTINVLVLASFIWATMFLAPAPQKAASESTIQLYNVAGQAAFTLLRGLIQGKVKSFKDVTKMLLYGSVAGYGFYQAKKMIGNGQVTTGMILANLSASVTENVACGYHPLAFIGYSLGPVRVEVATPFAKSPTATFNISVSPSDLITLYYAIKQSDHISFRNGMFTFTADNPVYDNALGWTRGIYPTVLADQADYVFNHEAVHVAQHLQLMSISPEWSMCCKTGCTDKKPSLFKINGVRYNALGLGLDLLTYKVQDYQKNLFEVEAYHFASE
jgi:hypothetical protein